MDRRRVKDLSWKVWSENNAIDPLEMSRPVETGVSFCLLRLHDIFGAKRRKAPPPPEFAKVVPVQTADVPKVKAWVFRWNWTRRCIVVDYSSMNMLKVQVKDCLKQNWNLTVFFVAVAQSCYSLTFWWYNMIMFAFCQLCSIARRHISYHRYSIIV